MCPRKLRCKKNHAAKVLKWLLYKQSSAESHQQRLRPHSFLHNFTENQDYVKNKYALWHLQSPSDRFSCFSLIQPLRRGFRFPNISTHKGFPSTSIDRCVLVKMDEISTLTDCRSEPIGVLTKHPKTILTGGCISIRSLLNMFTNPFYPNGHVWLFSFALSDLQCLARSKIGSFASSHKSS